MVVTMILLSSLSRLSFKAAAIRAVYAVGRKALVFLHGLVVEVFSVHYKKHLIDKRKLCGQTSAILNLTFHPVFGLAGGIGSKLCSMNAISASQLSKHR